ncbi:hypothetical protein ES703_108370 [subsurface metagenome]
MGRGTGFGKTILIGDQFVRRGVPAIVSSIPYETVATVERIDKVHIPQGMAESTDHLHPHGEKSISYVKPLDVRRPFQSTSLKLCDIGIKGPRVYRLQLIHHPVRLWRNPFEADPDPHIGPVLVIAYSSQYPQIDTQFITGHLTSGGC